ncbi:type II toxin-antitoxin system RelE family toxin [Variovorax paradoxus]|uniref:type II toxin-antitoxin system RelE family toxin n=1 Tax=Variovorax paradoxus TaxID=34073 RepID=UPI0027D89B55|nr:type II toxin-antitoxin system RelE/ParE family toxin [Variovorax paradoxus]
MPLNLAFTEDALSAVEALPRKIRLQVVSKIQSLEQDPHPPGSKKLVGVEDGLGRPVYRERSGDYRILYVVQDLELLILDVDHRKDVYRGRPPDGASAQMNSASMKTLADGTNKKKKKQPHEADILPFPSSGRGARSG